MKARLSTILLAALLVVLAAVVYLSTSNERGRQFSPRQLEAIVDEALANDKSILGTIVRVDIEGGGTYEAAAGYLDASRTTPLTPQTRFLVGSIGKTFTAVLVLQLVEQGRVRLEDRLIDHLPPEWSAILDEIQNGREMTVEQALRHRTGIADFTNSDAFWDLLVHSPTRKWQPLDVLRRVRDEHRANFRPGSAFEYCNTNYILLGALVEHASGRPYRQLLRETILDEIGLDRTFPVEDSLGSCAACDVPIARGYSTIDGRLRDGRDVSVDWAMAEGALVSNAADLSRFLAALRNGELFQHRDTFRRMSDRGPNDAYGLGLEVVDDPDIGLHYGHKGSFLNTRTIVAYFPARRMTVTVCRTYTAFSMAAPEDLMSSVVRHILGFPAVTEPEAALQGPDLFAALPSPRINQDRPAGGEWDFDPRPEWSLDRIGAEPFVRPSRVAVGAGGTIVLLDRGTARVFVLSPSGALLHAFGDVDDVARLGFPIDMFVAADTTHVLYMGNKKDTVVSYGPDGGVIGTHELERGISPRVFVDEDRYIAVHSSADVLERQPRELLELRSLSRGDSSVLGAFPAEDKLILPAILPRGRFILLEDAIELFPRVIAGLDKSSILLGRSDRYLIEKIDLEGSGRLAFSIEGRERRSLPPGYASARADEARIADDKPLPADARERFLAGYPVRQTFFTRIATDDDGLVYVFVPDILHPGRQEIDIFSPQGDYLHHAVVELPGGSKRVAPLVFDGDHLLALLESTQGAYNLVRYRIRRPTGSGH